MNILRKSVSSFLRSRTHVIPYYNRSYSLYEPDYLDSLKPQVPVYDTLNIEIRGYDFPVLESYQKFIHRMLNNMEVDVEDGWATPAKHLKVVTYKPNTEIVNSQYELKVYQRTVQISDVPSSQFSIILRLLEASAPPGVKIDVVPHEEIHEEIRYVPDNELNKLKQELEDMGGPPKKK